MPEMAISKVRHSFWLNLAKVSSRNNSCSTFRHHPSGFFNAHKASHTGTEEAASNDKIGRSS